MNKLITIILLSLVLVTFFSCSKDNEDPQVNNPPVVVKKNDSVTLGANYANEVYYSLASGVVQVSPRATWDIAFRTMKRSSSVIINDGAGVVLYSYPYSDTSGWANVIDTSVVSGLRPMYNDPDNWENGAFSRYAKGHPDYGWGIYNDVTHNLAGDSIFIIKLRDKTFRKLWIVKKLSAQSTYVFRYAHLDGSDERTVTEVLSGLAGTDFSGYSLLTNERVAFEPAKTTWDLLFTKYMSVQQDGSPYLVTGVLSNDSVKSKRFRPVALTYSDYTPGTWDSTRSSVGWDWKKFDMNTYTYKMVDSTVYFVKQVKGDVYKLYFTGFSGTSTGVVRFYIEK